MLPANFKLQYDRAQIAEAVQRMGQEISSWAEKVWQESHTDVVAVPVLRGGIFFFADLVREVGHSMEIAPAQTWTYESDANAVQRESMSLNLEQVPLKGRAILLIDDICDSGKTLRVLTETMSGQGAREVRSAVLIKRQLDEKTFDPDWVGFKYNGPEWMVGYGMEDCNRWRNLPSIYTIKQA